MKDEERFATKVIEALEPGVQSLNEETAARLAQARERAVSAMAGSHEAYAELALAGWHRLVAFSRHGGHRFWVPLLVLLAALVVAVNATFQNHDSRPIDVDALLLASDLPPEAYADKEFVAWLESTSQH
jgi:hypothetical protein